MRKIVSVAALGAVVLAGLVLADQQGETTAAGKEWSFNATIIEACSCPMFCPCYFNPQPAGHAHGGETEHYCRFNMGYKVNEGHYGDVKLDGAKFWVAGDLGEDFTSGEWAVVAFDPSVTPEQREGIKAIVGKVYPIEWGSFAVGEDAPIEWTYSKERAVATLNGGKTAEVVLTRGPGMTGGSPVIKNLQYWGVPRNDGFVLMPNEVQAYRVGDKAFETRGTNGFMITLDIASSDFE